MAGRVQDKVALITGAASGLGRASAIRLAEEGAKVALTDLDETGGQASLDIIRQAGGEAIFLRQDVTSEADWEAAVGEVRGRYGRLDILVNNAGIAIGKPLLATTLEDWRRQNAVNLDGVFLGTKAGIQAMIPTGGGSIVNISSIAGIIGAPMMAGYCASKGGVRLFTKAAAMECAQMKWNIRVNSVHPAFVWTPMVEKHVREMPEPEKARAYLDSLQPLGHMGEPVDIAEGVLYLASDAAKFVTGSELVIDGGMTAR